MKQPELASTLIRTRYGDFELHCFSWGPHEEDNTLCLKRQWTTSPPLVRVQSACYTAEIFQSLDCDCHEQLHRSLEAIQSQGGILVYMLCDGRGAGLLTKIRGIELGRTKGLDTADAYTELGVELDPRTYERAAHALKQLGAEDIRLLTNNPRKVDGLILNGVSAVREPLLVSATNESRPYLKTKQNKMGHLLGLLDSDQ